MRLTGKFRGPHLLAAFAILLALPLASQADSEAVSRYPYDPACPWGRIANGKGMIHRCLTKKEATRIARAEQKRKEKRAKALAARCKDGDEKCKEKAAAAATAKPASAPAADKAPLPRNYEIKLGPIVADKGEITVGRLNLPMDRYKECIVAGGGLSKPQAKVVVQFLARSERSRAEGVSLVSADGISEKAGECIADVVDRRKVGTPSAALTPVKLTFAITEKN